MSFLSQPLQSVLIKPIRTIGTIAVQVVVNENTTDTLTITRQPVQQGASITDHAFMEPTSFSHTIYYAAPGFTGGESLSDIYEKLLKLQVERIPFSIVTPKRVYTNMLMATLSQTTDKSTENCLAINAAYQQIILVPILTANVPARSKQKFPGSTGATVNTGNKSAILKTSNAFGFGGNGFTGP